MGKNRDRAEAVLSSADAVILASVSSGEAFDCLPDDLVGWAFEVALGAVRKGEQVLAEADARDAEEKAGA